VTGDGRSDHLQGEQMLRYRVSAQRQSFQDLQSDDGWAAKAADLLGPPVAHPSAVEEPVEQLRRVRHLRVHVFTVHTERGQSVGVGAQRVVEVLQDLSGVVRSGHEERSLLRIVQALMPGAP
jgi:hypothetical protein